MTSEQTIRAAAIKALGEAREASDCYLMNRYPDAQFHIREASRVLQEALAKAGD